MQARSSIAVSASLALTLTPLACGPAPVEPAAPPPPAPVPTAAPAITPGAIPARRGHTALAAPREDPRPFVIQPIPGGRAILAVSQQAGDRDAWVRRIDAAGPGPALRFLDRRVIGALDREGPPVFLTSTGDAVCLTSEGWPRDACVDATPAAIVPAGDRVALLELRAMKIPEPAGSKPRPAKPAAKPAKTPSGKAGSAKAHAGHAGHGKKKGARADAASKAGGAKGKKKKAGHAAPAHRVSHPLVELFVRWVDAGGRVDEEAKPTGLHFEAPLDGMTLVDARARAPGIDLLWYETAPGRRARTPLGSGRLMAGSLRADGTLDFASRAAVVDADVEYGHLKDHRSPRLVGTDAGTAFVSVTDKGECEAMRVKPALARLSPPPSACAVAPDRLAASIEAADLSAFDRILADAPRRAFGQPKTDFGLAAWAGDRAYWLHGDTLRSEGRADPAPRDEPPPFPARRARIAWGALAVDGEGVAFVEGRVVHVDARVSPPVIQPAPAPAGVAPGLLAAAEDPAAHRRAARIGDTWWTARGARIALWPRVAPGPRVSTPGQQVLSAVTGDHHPDTSVLIGGRSTGVSLDLAGGSLHISAVTPAGETSPLAALTPSPLQPGFDACERRAGGAIVAGVSRLNPAEVVAFTVDSAGRASPPQRMPISVHPGALLVRLTPLPRGGALLTDRDRRHVIWLDDEGRSLGAADWPVAESDAVCADGRPMRRSMPGPDPGQFIPLPEVEEGACAVGDAVWGEDGRARWLGASVHGLDSIAEVVSLPLLPSSTLPPPPPPPPPPAPAPGAPFPPSRCPAEMVSIAGKFCVDRFESSLLDARTGEALSPDYPATPGLLDFALSQWATGRERAGNVHARAFPLPFLSPARIGDKPDPVAAARLGVRPSGYVTGVVAEAACAAAGKRLCTLDEFVTACRGEADTLFPYGDTYEDGVCNVFREEHPAALLHGNASVGHLDPRLNRVISKGRPMLQDTGESPACRSRWGDDAVYDMVGNLDEWVDEGNGAFAGGFYARSTRSGCEALVTAHPKSYLDYSTGVRCCKD